MGARGAGHPMTGLRAVWESARGQSSVTCPDWRRPVLSSRSSTRQLATSAGCRPSDRILPPPPHAKLSPKSRKENNNEIDTIPLPLPHGENFKRTWGEWVIYRTKTKKRLSRFAQEKQLKLLEGLTEQEAVDCINRSIANDWQGLFPEKTKNSKPFAKILTREDHNNGF